MHDIHPLALVGLVLLIIGGLNWGLVGAFNFDLVAFLLGPASVLSRIVYVLVGLSAIGIGLWLPTAAFGWNYSSLKHTTSGR